MTDPPDQPAGKQPPEETPAPGKPARPSADPPPRRPPKPRLEQFNDPYHPSDLEGDGGDDTRDQP